MKRVMNDVALSTVLGLFLGFTKVIIEDRKHKDLYVENSPDTEKWEGLVKDVWFTPDKIRYKWMKSKVHAIQPLPSGTVLFIISTQFEEY